MGVWGLVVGLIFVTALISVWFSGMRISQVKRPERAQKRYYARQAVDEFLQKGMFFCSAGVEQDERASLPQKLLMFGFSFFILILVSAYVANLAAFLTQPDDNMIYTMQQVESRNVRVCANPVLKEEMQVAWPNVNFVFTDSRSFTQLLGDYKDGLCEAIAAGRFDLIHDLRSSREFCNANLVFTESLVIENPVAFPIRPELAAGFSYWMYKGEKRLGIDLESSEEEYAKTQNLQPFCEELHSFVGITEANEMEQIKPENLVFPLAFFLGFAGLAILVQLYHNHIVSRGVTRSVFGRVSTFGAQHAAAASHAPNTGDAKVGDPETTPFDSNNDPSSESWFSATSHDNIDDHATSSLNKVASAFEDNVSASGT